MSKVLGSALVRVSGRQDDADRQARRALDWRQHAAGPLATGPELAAYFADLDSSEDETRAQELLMARHGLALEAPSDWKAPAQ